MGIQQKRSIRPIRSGTEKLARLNCQKRRKIQRFLFENVKFGLADQIS